MKYAEFSRAMYFGKIRITSKRNIFCHTSQNSRINFASDLETFFAISLYLVMKCDLSGPVKHAPPSDRISSSANLKHCTASVSNSLESVSIMLEKYIFLKHLQLYVLYLER